MSGQLERMRVFLSVAELRSFAAAARRLQMSTSAVTRHVGDLERDLGAQLLMRTTRRVSLTRPGEDYAKSVKAILEEVETANLSAKQTQGALTGELRVSAPLSLGIRLLPPALARFRAAHPELRLSLSLSDRFVDVVGEGFDMALRVSGPPADKSTIWRKICIVPRLLVASPGYLRGKRSPRAPRDLAEHACIGYANLAAPDRWTFTHAPSKQRQSVRLTFGFECDNGDVAAEMAALGEGIALLPRFIVAKHLEAGTLALVLPAWSAPEIWLTAYFPPYETLPGRVDAFARFVERWIAADPTMLTGAATRARPPAPEPKRS
jgi:DNA-binding transcriptional LysR family regulator